MFLVKTVAQYTEKYFQKSLVGVIILRDEVEKDIALNTAAFRRNYGVNSCSFFDINNNSGIYSMNPVAGSYRGSNHCFTMQLV